MCRYDELTETTKEEQRKQEKHVCGNVTHTEKKEKENMGMYNDKLDHYERVTRCGVTFHWRPTQMAKNSLSFLIFAVIYVEIITKF